MFKIELISKFVYNSNKVLLINNNVIIINIIIIKEKKVNLIEKENISFEANEVT